MPNPNDGVEADEAAGAAPVEAPPNREGFAASPVFVAEPKPKLGVEDAPAVAPPPKRPPAGLLAGVLDAPPPKRPEPPAVAPPPPNNPAPGVLDAGVAAPKSDGDAAPDVVPAPPNSPPAGLDAPLLALLPAGCPKVKPDMVACEEVDHADAGAGWCMGVWVLVVGGCCLLLRKVVYDAQLAPGICRDKEDETDRSAQNRVTAVKARAMSCSASFTGASLSQPKVGQTAAWATRRTFPVIR